MKKTLLAATSVFALVAVSAFAQDAASPATAPSANPNTPPATGDAMVPSTTPPGHDGACHDPSFQQHNASRHRDHHDTALFRFEPLSLAL